VARGASDELPADHDTPLDSSLSQPDTHDPAAAEPAAVGDSAQGDRMNHTDSSGLTILAPAEIERSGSWLLVRRSLGLAAFGLNVVEIAPGDSIPEHDETGRDQEEVFLALAGDVVLVVDGQDHALSEGSFARLDTKPRRTVRNDGPGAARVLIASAPRTSGYEPMGWA